MNRRPWTLLAIAGGVAMVLVVLTQDWWSRHLPACIFRRLTGWNCPGCGGTRCAMRLVHGDVPGAMAMNPFVVLLFFAGLGWLIASVWREWRNQPPLRIPGKWVWTIFTIFIVFSLTRNLPWWPFTLLSPPPR